jgi:hypothetical protein
MITSNLTMVVPDMLNYFPHPRNSVLLSTRKRKLTQYLNSQVLLQYVYVCIQFYSSYFVCIYWTPHYIHQPFIIVLMSLLCCNTSCYGDHNQDT